MIQYESYINKQTLNRYRGCDSIFSTIVVTPQERLGICCGLTREQIPELNFDIQNNSLRSLLEQALDDFLKIWIFVEGPAAIVAWAAEKDPSIAWEDRFAHICDICRFMYTNPRVREVIMRHDEEKLFDVTMRFALLNKAKPFVSRAFSGDGEVV